MVYKPTDKQKIQYLSYIETIKKTYGRNVIITVGVYLETVLSSVLTCEELCTEWPGWSRESSPGGQHGLRGSQESES